MDSAKGAASCRLGDDSDEDNYDIPRTKLIYDIKTVYDNAPAASAPPYSPSQIYYVKFLYTPFIRMESLNNVIFYNTSRIQFNDLESVDETAEAGSTLSGKEDAVCCQSDDSDEAYYGTLQTQLCHLLSMSKASLASSPLCSPTQIYPKKVKFYYYGIWYESPDPYVDLDPIFYINMSSAQSSPKNVVLQHDPGFYKAPDANSDTASHYNAIDSEKTQALYLTMMDVIVSRNNAGPGSPTAPAPQSPRRNSGDPERERQPSGCFNFRQIT